MNILLKKSPPEYRKGLKFKNARVNPKSGGVCCERIFEFDSPISHPHVFYTTKIKIIDVYSKWLL